MFKRNPYCICISLTEDMLKIVQLKGVGSSAKVNHILSKDIQGIEEDALPKVLQSSLHGFKVKFSDIISIIPSSMVTTKNIEIPSVNDDEIKSIVNLQAGRHTPFSREEIQIGYINLGVFKNNYTRVLLIIANKNVLKKQMNLFEKIGLKVKQVLFAPEGVANLYVDILNLKEEEGSVGIIDVGRNSTDFILIHQKTAFAFRNIPVGKTQLSSGGPASEQKLVDELKKTIESYENEEIGDMPSRFIITVDDDYTKSLQTVLASQLKWNVQNVPYVDFVKATPKALKQAGDAFLENSFLDIIAAGSFVENAQVDLVPEEIQMKKSIQFQGQEIFKAAVLGFILMVLVAGTLGLKIYFKSIFLNKLTNQYQDTREEVASLENISTQTRLIQNYLESRMVSLDTIKELYNSVPDEIYLTGIVMDEEGNISVHGISDIASLIFNLGATLKESELFKKVNIKSTTARKDRGKDVSAFEITLKLKTAVEEDVEEEAEEAVE